MTNYAARSASCHVLENDEARMTNDELMTKSEAGLFVILASVILSSFVISHSSFQSVSLEFYLRGLRTPHETHV
jgi:hypothetical protein